MLHEFLRLQRAELIARCKVNLRERFLPDTLSADMEDGVPVFLDQLIDILEREQLAGVSAHAPLQDLAGASPRFSDIAEAAKRNAGELLRRGFTIDQVVYNYGDLCQAITAAASDHSAPIGVDEFRTLDSCLNKAMAGAVVEFSRQSARLIAGRDLHASNIRVGSFACELDGLSRTATLAASAMKEGRTGLDGATGAVLDRSLKALQHLVERVLFESQATEDFSLRPQALTRENAIAEPGIPASLAPKTG